MSSINHRQSKTGAWYCRGADSSDPWHVFVPDERVRAGDRVHLGMTDGDDPNWVAPGATPRPPSPVEAQVVRVLSHRSNAMESGYWVEIDA